MPWTRAMLMLLLAPTAAAIAALARSPSAAAPPVELAATRSPRKELRHSVRHTHRQPGGERELWPDPGSMPGERSQSAALDILDAVSPKGEGGRYQRLMKTEESPPEDQVIRMECSPNHVGTWGRYYLDVSVPTLTAYEAPSAKRAVVVAPGGGGLHLAWDVEGLDVGETLQKMGISAFVLAYRVPTAAWEGGAHLMDIQRAISQVREQGYEHVGVFGSSFGGGAACDVSMAAERLYNATDGVDAHSCTPDFAVLLYPGDMRTEGRGAAGQQKPATFMVVAEDDPCTGPVIARDYFYKTLLGREEVAELPHDAADRHELHVYEEGMHGFGTCHKYPEIQGYPVCQWPKMMLGWLDKHLPP